MIVIHLNLLAPLKKAKFSALVRYLFVKENLELVMLTAALLAITHLWGWLLLTNVLTDLAQTTTNVGRKFTAHNQQVRGFNRLMKQITLTGENFKPTIPFILDIAKTLPADIKLTTLDFNSSKRTITLTGLADTRDALLGYHKTLRSLPWIANVNTPASELFQKDNISFTIEAALKLTKAGSALRTPTAPVPTP